MPLVNPSDPKQVVHVADPGGTGLLNYPRYSETRTDPALLSNCLGWNCSLLAKCQVSGCQTSQAIFSAVSLSGCRERDDPYGRSSTEQQGSSVFIENRSIMLLSGAVRAVKRKVSDLS